MRPRLLDLFCGAGGAAMGYHRAGFDVLGVDIEPQPRYPFEFVQADAIEVLRVLCEGADDLEVRNGGELGDDQVCDLVGVAAVAVGCFDVQVNQDRAGHDGAPSLGAHHCPKPAFNVKDWAAIHASPPCQDYSKAMRHLSHPQQRLIDPVRELLEQAGFPWVIENVEGSPLPRQDTLDGRYGVELCGTMFGLRVRWHRLFETSFPVYAPRGCDHRAAAMNPHNQIGRDRIYAEHGRSDPEAVWRRERGTPWMTRYEAREAIPPAYTELIGRQLLTHLEAAACA